MVFDSTVFLTIDDGYPLNWEQVFYGLYDPGSEAIQYEVYKFLYNEAFTLNFTVNLYYDHTTHSFTINFNEIDIGNTHIVLFCINLFSQTKTFRRDKHGNTGFIK